LHSIVQFGHEKIVKYGLRIINTIRQFLQQPMSAEEAGHAKEQIALLSTESIRSTISLPDLKEKELQVSEETKDEFDDDAMLQDLIDTELRSII